jgi:hypothetical protein
MNARILKRKQSNNSKSNMNTNEKKGRGRPANDRSVTLSVRVTQEAVDKLNRLTNNKSEYIDHLIKEQPE